MTAYDDELWQQVPDDAPSPPHHLVHFAEALGPVARARRVRHRWDSGPRLLAWIEKQLRELTGTRWIIVLGGGVAVLVFAASLVGGTRPVPAFFLGLGAYASVVGLAGASRQI